MTTCPFSEWQGQSLAAREISAQCVFSVTSSRAAAEGDDLAPQDEAFHLSQAAQIFLIGAYFALSCFTMFNDVGAVGAILVALVLLAMAVQQWRRRRGQAYFRAVDASQHNSSSLMSASRLSGTVVAGRDEEASSHGSEPSKPSALSRISKMPQALLSSLGRGSGAKKPKGGEYEKVSSPFTLVGEDDDEEEPHFGEEEE